MSARPTLHLVDASMYVFRAYYSVAPEFFDHEQQPVHAVSGFLSFLLTLIEQAEPTHLGVAFDESLTTSFRNRIYPAYKANRELPPPDLDRQFRYCRELTAALGLFGMSDAEYEADDLIGSAATRARNAGFRSVIVSGDKDLGQLLGEHDQIWDFARRERYGPDGVRERLGVAPEQVADFLALTGDAVDNIPGVPGIGPKTAAPLLAHFGTLDAVLERVEEIPFLRLRGAAATAQKLRQYREQALLSRQLTVIAFDAPLPGGGDIEVMRPAKPDAAALDTLLDRLRFGPLTRRRVRDYVEKRG
jgi:5'-3' exonuclease